MENVKTKNSDILNYLDNQDIEPLFIEGNAFNVLKNVPDESINCIITSPPYWNKRKYISGGIGLEPTYEDFVDNI